MIQLKSETRVYKVLSEEEAMSTIEDFKSKQIPENYILSKYNTTYKCKKDRKTGEVVDEYWLVSVTLEHEVM